MNDMTPIALHAGADQPLNPSRRGFLGASLGALALGIALPGGASAQGSPPAITPGTRVSAFLEIRPDNTVLFRSAFIEGGQGIYTGLAQIVGEELDVDPAQFVVEAAPPGPDYLVMNGRRITGGSNSMRSSYEPMRRLGAAARQMLLQAAATRLGVPAAELATEPGHVVHAASGRTLAYGELAGAAADLPVPTEVVLRSRAEFRWIGKPVARIDVPDKSTGKARYTIDLAVEGMLHGAVQHARRLGMEPASIANEDQVRAMPGVHSVHKLPGAVAVVANSWWRARRAAEALQVTWTEPAPGTANAMPGDFSSEARRAALAAASGDGIAAESFGDVDGALRTAAQVIESTYHAPYLAHAQLEPPAALARWNEDGTLELWTPNQAPDVFQGLAAK